jgi:hypothetical protein
VFKLNPILCAVAVWLVASLACTTSSVSVATPVPGLMDTAVAQTVVVLLTQTAQPSIPITGLGSPTFTPTVTLSPTPIFTSTPAIPQIVVTVATNCRVGPGKIYDRIGALLVGEVAEVYGMNPTGEYWYIRNPDADGYCWVWGEYATLVGDLSALPIYTPPPTPTPIPAFEVSYKGLETCVGWWVDLELKNTGGVPFKSVTITLRDTTNNVVLAMTTNGFTNNDGCLVSTTKDNLNPGGAHIVSSPTFNYDPTGHTINAAITVCSNKAISGTCVSQEIEFKP